MSLVPTAAIPAAPTWLVELVEKPVPKPAPPVNTTSAADRIRARLSSPEPSGSAAENFARTVLDAAARDLATAAEGTRNHTLNRVAFDLFGLTKGGRLDRDVVIDTLTSAAGLAGLGAKEIGATLGSAERQAEAKTGAPLRREQAPVTPTTVELVVAAQKAHGAPEWGDTPLTVGGKPEPETEPQAPAEKEPAAPESRAERQIREEREHKLALVELTFEAMRAKLLTDEQVVDLPPPQPLIKGLLMRDSLAVLYGRPGNGKSFVTIDWALSIAYGQWWDMRPVVQGPVLYIAAEGAAGLGKRVRAWKAHHKVIGHIPGFWLYPERVNLLDTVAPAALVLLARSLGPQLVVIDTLSRSMPGGNENAPEDMTTAMENADLIRRETGSTVLLVHHTPKDGGSIRGHSSLEGAADTTFEVKKAETVVTIANEKQKDSEEAAPIVRYLRPVQFGAERNPEVDSAILSATGNEEQEERAGLAAQRETYLVLQRNTGRDESMSSTRWEELAKDAGVPRATFFRAKKELADEGFVRNVGTVRTPKWQVAKPW